MFEAADQQIIYLIDEDEVVRDSLKVLLESHGMQVREFASPGAFLASCRTARDGCLLLGFNRLILDGLELVATLRRIGNTLPVVFIVGGGDAAAKAAVLAAGASAYIERPVEETALIRAVRAALVRQRSRRQDPSVTAPLATL